MRREHLLRKQIDTERKKKRIVLYTVFLVSVCYLAATLIFNDMGIIKYLQLRQSERKLVRDIAALEQENAAITAEIRNFQDNPFYLERHAREDLNLSRPDEIIFMYER